MSQNISDPSDSFLLKFSISLYQYLSSVSILFLIHPFNFQCSSITLHFKCFNIFPLIFSYNSRFISIQCYTLHIGFRRTSTIIFIFFLLNFIPFVFIIHFILPRSFFKSFFFFPVLPHYQQT